MQNFFLIVLALFYSNFSVAQSNYQVDLILFAHPQNNASDSEIEANTPMLPVSSQAIPLSANSQSLGHYTLLPPSKSGLKDQYYLLSKRSTYKVLGRYSWKQPGDNFAMVALPHLDSQGWQMQGTIQVQQSNYYSFKSKLQFSPPSNPNASFTVEQTQRLKGNTVYYFDHAKIGMIVAIHKIA